MKAKATLRAPEMNKTEEKYAWLLEVRRRAGEITRYDFGKVTFKLGDDCRYTPDFMVVRSDLVIEFHEVKGGFEREDAMVKRRPRPSSYRSSSCWQSTTKASGRLRR